MRGCSGLSLVGALLMISSSLGAQDVASLKMTADVIYGHKAGMALTYDVIYPTQPNGAAVLFMVSGGWVSRWSEPEGYVKDRNAERNPFIALVNAGYTLFMVRHGSSPHFKVPEAVGDVRRAVRFVRLHAADYKIDDQRIGVAGMSAGGHLALMLGTTGDAGNPGAEDPVERIPSRVAATVSYFPPTKIDEFFPLVDRFPALDFDHNLAESVSPLLQVTQDDAPALLVHGDKDELVPISNSERIAEAFKTQQVPTELLVIKDAAHVFKDADATRAIQTMIGWFNKHLAAK
jgi:acetyl esterase/lipase